MSINADTPYPGSKHPVLPTLPRPSRTEPSYPPEPPPEPAPTPFTLIAQRTERQPPKVVLTADEAAERMKALKERQSEDPVLKLQIVELQAKLADQRIRIDGLMSVVEAWMNRYNDLEKRFTAHVSHALAAVAGVAQSAATADRRLQEQCDKLGDRLQPPSVAALPPKKIAAKKKSKP